MSTLTTVARKLIKKKKRRRVGSIFVSIYVPEPRQIFLGEEMRESELLPKPITADEAANVDAIFAQS